MSARCRHARGRHTRGFHAQGTVLAGAVPPGMKRQGNPTWEDIIDGGEPVSRQRFRRGRLTVLSILCIVLGAVVMTSPLTVALTVLPPHSDGKSLMQHEDQATLVRAAAYNRRLLQQGSEAVGEGVSFAERGQTAAWRSDADYLNQLDIGADMARIRIPSISVDLPVSHGTGREALATQAGHVYGTMLPTGDMGNSVIAAHRGLGMRMLFYRVGELRDGDVIYTQAAGRIVAWQVDGAQSGQMAPNSSQERRVFQMRATMPRLTIYTCDPPGLNTRRLVIVANKIPYHENNASASTRKDWLPPLISSGASGLMTLVVMLIAIPRIPVMRHAAFEER